MIHKARRFLFAILMLVPSAALAQTTGDSTTQLMKPEAIEQLVSPIALYPDTLLSQVLMASTYPLEIVQAQRWSDQNKNLKGDALKTALDKQTWDGSVKALVATPSVLSMMGDQLDWTQKLGDTVLAQQPDVMDAIQRLRGKAQANNKLTSTKEQKVTVSHQDNRQVISIEPTDPETLYVPYYDPAVVYGDWPYSDYPPYYWGAPGYIGAGLIASGVAFGAGYALGRWTSGGNYWGGGINWNNNNLVVNRPTHPIAGGGGNNWQHNPDHRQGVRYGNNDVAKKFGGDNRAGGRDARLDYRGRDGNQVLKPGSSSGLGDRDGLGDRGGAGDRAGLGERGDRPGTGDRAGNRGDIKGPGDRAKGSANQRPGGGNKAGNKGGGNKAGGRDNALGNISSGKVANKQAARGRASAGPRPSGGVARGGGGGAPRMAAGGGGMRAGGGGGGGFRGGGGGGGRGGGGGGRRSDIALKHDIALLGRLDNGLGFYRFAYNGGTQTYVGVMAQEVLAVRPDAVTRGRDGYLRVFYDRLGIPFQSYARWLASGARIPTSMVQP